jgi:signal peptidase I
MSKREGGGQSRPSFARRALRWLEHFLAACGVVLLGYHLCFDLSVMVSGSMAPTLQGESAKDGDWVLTEKLTFRLRRPRRWEVMTFRTSDGLRVMKRVVGLPGEKVSLNDDRTVLVDGTPAERPPSLDRIEYLAVGEFYGGREADCGDGYFVLGDDSKDSFDSRFEGPIAAGQIKGRAWLVVWPPARFGLVNP